ncbi:MAG: hypothetical protein WAU91_23510, partial [Desulfatitalea sp.]
MRRILFIACLIFCVFTCVSCTKNITSDTSVRENPAPKCDNSKKSIFSDAAPDLDMDGYSIEETLQKNWYAYPVNNDRGFNPFFIPFDYLCTAGKPDPMQRLTFPVLLSLKFDFVDNNICTRHPAFVYSRDPDSQELSMSDVNKVIQKMQEWGQNVAVGGTLIQHGNKYSGTLKIIDKDKVLLEKQFQKSGYFELMGKMVMAWIEFSGGHVSDKLKSELIRPMTRSSHAIVLLGQALKLQERSDEMWKMYEKILEIDPDFAELRWWYANQKWWHTNDRQYETSMMLRALESHLVVTALKEVEYSDSPNLGARYAKVFLRAKTIMPKHWVITGRESYDKWDKMDRSEALRLSAEAIKAPYAYFFSNQAAKKCYNQGDYQVSIPLMLSIVNSGYNPGDGSLPEFQRLVFSFIVLGHLRDSLALVPPMFNYSKDKNWAILYSGYIMDEAMDFDKPIEMFKAAAANNNRLAVEF